MRSYPLLLVMLAVGCGGSTAEDEAPGLPASDSGGSVETTTGDETSVVEDSGVAEDPVDAPPPTTPESTPESMSFPLGIAMGDATDTRAVAWASYSGSATLALVVWKMSGTTYVKELPAVTVKATDGVALADVLGLEAGARYRYAFFELEGDARKARSPIGSFRAAIAPGSKEKLTFGATSCIHQGRALATLGQAAKLDLDAFLFLGDSTYNDGAISVPEFRAKWAENFKIEHYRALRRSTSLIATWDDHEVDNDWSGDDKSQRTAGIQVFYEMQPVQRNSADPNRLWRSIKWGDTVEVFVLDSRSERKPSTRSGPDAEYISKAQQTWLESGLKSSTATFKLIMNSVPISNFPGVFDFASKDRWEGYAAQRTAVLKSIEDNKIGGVLWISGDFHLASTGRVSPSGVGAAQIEALVGPGDNTGNALSYSLGKPQFDWASSTSNITKIELDPATRAAKLTWIDKDGKTLKEQSYTL